MHDDTNGAMMNRCAIVRTRTIRATLHVLHIIARCKTGGRTTTRGRVHVRRDRSGTLPVLKKPKKFKLHSSKLISASEESSKPRPFRVDSPRYGIGGEGMVSKEEDSISGNDAFRAFLMLGVFPLFGLAALVFFNDDLRAQYLQRWIQDTEEKRTFSSPPPTGGADTT